jgi:hypothetical protein
LSKQGYYLTGLKLISAGIFILALEQAALAVLRAWKYYAFGEFAAQFLVLIGWLFILGGILSAASYRPEFLRVRTAAILCTVCSAAAIALAVYNYRSGMANQTFIEVKVLFLGYLSTIGLVFTYAQLMKGLAALGGKSGQSSYAKTCRYTWKPVVVTVLLIMVLEPAVSVFPQMAEWIGTAALAAVSFAYQMRIVWLLGSGRKLLNGRGRG